LPGPRLQGPATPESFTCPVSIPSQWTGTCLHGVYLLELSPRPEHHALPRSCPPAVIRPIDPVQAPGLPELHPLQGLAPRPDRF
jgi:hypothetical protein